MLMRVVSSQMCGSGGRHSRGVHRTTVRRDGVCQPPATAVIAAAASSGDVSPANSSAVWSLTVPPTSAVKNWSRIQLHERRVVQPVEHGLHVRVGHRVVRRLVHRQAAVLRPRALVVGVGDELEEVDRFRRGVLADGEAVGAAERVGRLRRRRRRRSGTGTNRARTADPDRASRPAWFLNAPGAH